jgi:uncharacterized protein
MKERSSLLPAAVLAAGLVTGGWLIGRGFARAHAPVRSVTVKGVAERDVEADVALWPLRFVATNDDLARAQERIKTDAAQIYAFLAHNGITAEHAELRALEVTDMLANPYGERTGASRYIISQTIMVRSDDPSMVLAATQKVGDLVSAGVVLTARDELGAGGPTFLFTRLNDLKPDMIAEATANARIAAEQFAKDSSSRLGAIRSANQGVFVILPRDQAPGLQEQQQMLKTVRVVTTVEYFLDE